MFLWIFVGLVFFISLFLYLSITKSVVENTSNNIKRLRYMSKDFPPPYPNSWYFVDYSTNIKKNQVKPYSICGRELVVFRNNSNKIGILHAFCPHMGTHLGYDGVVKNDNIVCPYHSWEFNPEGECENIPYSSSKPTTRCNSKSYSVLENHNMIFFWYHAENEPPNREIDLFREIDSSYRYISSSRMDTMNMHIFEPSQNSADYYHFRTVHRYLTNPFYKYLIEVEHRIKANYDTPYQQIEIKESIDNLYLFSRFKLPKFLATLLSTTVVIETPSLIMFKIDNPIFGNFRGILTFSPIEEFKQKGQLTGWCNGYWPWFIGRLLMVMVIHTVYQDRVVWEHKSHISPRNWVTGDGPFASYNKWLEKFYSKSSYKIDSQSLDW